MLRVLSLGLGVQSTTVALMAAHGEFGDMPDCAIFADTGWEPKRVYEQLDWLRSGNVLPFPVHVVSAGNIRDHILEASDPDGGRFVALPFYTADGGIGRRQCTREFKVTPIEKKVRELLGYRPRQRIPPGSAEMWIGISLDEAIRMKPARNAWQVNRWPLIEKRMSRGGCMNWLRAKEYHVPVKSSCIGCPYHNNNHWRDMRDHAEDEWADACYVDRKMRERGPLRGMRVEQFMHSDLKPLDEVDLRTAEDRGQVSLFNNDCEGMCGV